jgi:hypothetical protein
MTVNATALVSKLNFVMSSRLLANKQYIEEFPPLPQTGAQEEEIVKDLVFAYLKKKFPGCRIRQNQHSYSLRLDSHIHRKANKIREIYNSEPEWKSWFEQNHNQLYRRMRDNRNSFQSGYVVRREERNGNTFLYIPFKTNRIYQFIQSGLVDFVNWIDAEYSKDSALAAIHGEVTRLMEAEIQRREQERLERIRTELRDYSRRVMEKLFKPAVQLQESADATDRLFAHKFLEWARENGKAPEYAVAPTAAEMVPTGLKVKVMAPSGSEEEGWIALPPFDGYQEPEGYELQGWGKVTSIDMTGDRSRNGVAPIVIQDYIYAEFNMEFWKHLLPEGHTELLEVTQRIRREAEAEIEPWLEQERIQKEREEAEERARQEAERLRLEEERRQREEQIRREMEQERARQEAERIRRQEEEARLQELEEQERQRIEAEARANAERRHALAEQLRQQLQAQPAQPVVEEVPTQTPFDELIARLNAQVEEVVQAEPTAEPPRATAPGIYVNGRAIPLERYVVIREGGDVRRFRELDAACVYAGISNGARVAIHDYHLPFDVIEEYTYEEDLPF